jgi:hypothetical protein
MVNVALETEMSEQELYINFKEAYDSVRWQVS